MSTQEAAPDAATSSTVVVEKEKQKEEEKEEGAAGGGGGATLQLRRPETETPTAEKKKKAVGWTAETVDNEHLGKKKSKCCCVYVKPHKFKGDPGQESSSDESDGGDECDHCPGHHGKDLRRDPGAEGATE